jgi:hypothetical protein
MRLWEILFPKQNKTENYEFISRVLSDSTSREILLGVKRDAPMTPERYLEKVNSDVANILNHSKSHEYAVWAKEAWSEFLLSLDAVLDVKTDPKMVDFHRGGMRKTLDLLRMSYKAMDFKDIKKKEFTNKI